MLELLIALAIGLLILAAALAVYVSSSRASQLSQSETQLNEDGILALNLIQQQLKQAGYSQQIIPSTGAQTMSNFAGVAVRGCDNGFTDDSVPFADLTCAAATTSGGSAIAIRYEATLENTVPKSSPPIPSNCVGNGILQDTASQASPPPSTTPPSYALADNRFKVKVGSGNQPMLYCRGNEKASGVNSMGVAQPLLLNVEQMQILYGVASRPSPELASTYDPMRHQIVGYHDAAGVDALPTTNTLPSATDDRWARVLSVRVCLLMRSNEAAKDAPAGAAAYKDCSNVDMTSTDGYLRKAYITTVMLRNRMIVQ